MKNKKAIGVLLLILAVLTVAGMAIDNIIYLQALNYLTIIICVISAIALLKK